MLWIVGTAASTTTGKIKFPAVADCVVLYITRPMIGGSIE